MPRKIKDPPIDGLSPKDRQKVHSAVRQVWMRSYPRRLCIKRATRADGFLVCEQCKEVAPKLHIDHIEPVGSLSESFLERLFCPSTGLQALCHECHKEKTKAERAKIKQEGTWQNQDLGVKYVE